jgi:hypothetical protein
VPSHQDLDDLAGLTMMTGERVRALFHVEPAVAVARHLVAREEAGGNVFYRGTPRSTEFEATLPAVSPDQPAKRRGPEIGR